MRTAPGDPSRRSHRPADDPTYLRGARLARSAASGTTQPAAGTQRLGWANPGAAGSCAAPHSTGGLARRGDHLPVVQQLLLVTRHRQVVLLALARQVPVQDVAETRCRRDHLHPDLRERLLVEEPG